MSDTPAFPFTEREKDFLIHCEVANVVGAIIPSAIVGFIVRSSFPNHPQRNWFGLGVAVAYGSMQLGSSSMKCMRQFVHHPTFPTAVAIRGELRRRIPDAPIIRRFDAMHPSNQDARMLEQGGTMDGQAIPTLQLSDTFLARIAGRDNERREMEQAVEVWEGVKPNGEAAAARTHSQRGMSQAVDERSVMARRGRVVDQEKTDDDSTFREERDPYADTSSPFASSSSASSSSTPAWMRAVTRTVPSADTGTSSSNSDFDSDRGSAYSRSRREQQQQRRGGKRHVRYNEFGDEIMDDDVIMADE